MSKKIFLILLVGLALLYSCSTDKLTAEITVDHTTDNVLNIITSVNNNGWTETSSPIDTQTRAAIGADGMGRLEVGDHIGLFYKNERTGEVNFKSFIIGTDRLNWNDISPQNDPLTFYAYYPYNSQIADNFVDAEYSLSKEEWEGRSTDLLIADKVTARKGETVNLKFRHIMHKLTVELVAGEGFTGDLSKMEITLMPKYFKTQSKINIGEGKVYYPSTPEYVEDGWYKYKTGQHVDFIIAPQVYHSSLTNGSIEIKTWMPEKKYLYINNSGSVHLESGKQQKITITLKGHAPFEKMPTNTMFRRVAQYNLGKNSKIFATSHSRKDIGFYTYAEAMKACPDGYQMPPGSGSFRHGLAQLFIDEESIKKTWNYGFREGYGFSNYIAIRYRVKKEIGDTPHLELTGRYLGKNHPEVTLDVIRQKQWWDIPNEHDRMLIFPIVNFYNSSETYGEYWTAGEVVGSPATRWGIAFRDPMLGGYDLVMLDQDGITSKRAVRCIRTLNNLEQD